MRRVKAQVTSDLANARGFDITFLPELESAVNRSMVEFEDRYGEILRRMNLRAIDEGQRIVAEPLSDALDLTISSPGLSSTLFEVIQGTTADLVRDVANRTRNSINTQVRLATTGLLRPFEAQQRIAQILRSDEHVTDPDRPSFRKRIGIAAQAERIQRTEFQRIFSVANFESLARAKEQVPDLMKQWFTIRDGRQRTGPPKFPANHDILHLQVRRMNRRFSNGLRFPRDPGGPAGEIVNCRCQMLGFRPDWEAPVPEPKGVLSR